MKPLPLDSVIERRLLLNYRVDPDRLARLLPSPLRPQLVNGSGVGGICMIRLGQVRPPGFPRFVGQRSENAAHRIAVEWDTPDGVSRGVYIPRRDSASLLNVIVGGRLFPGIHHRASFDVTEAEGHFAVAFRADDGSAAVKVRAHLSAELTGSELFTDLAAASGFFRGGAAGYSPNASADCLDGIELQTDAWAIEPLTIDSAESSLFDDRELFPAGTASLDSALVMRDVPVRWRGVERMRSHTLIE